ncbi:MAG TPA: GNAT family N-acetyltransferase [Gaiellaceae bacterium]|nr:GNAT family N-acetyltransferase [Gaiellaceae bacterium]
MRDLLREYEAWTGVDLCFQGFEEELAGLPGDYDPTRDGALLVLDGEDGRLAGCVGVRRIDETTCELKRLYLRPSARGGGRGRALLEAAVERARALGYRSMRLDTLPVMDAAQSLYRSRGFVEIPPYRENPVPGARCFELAL